MHENPASASEAALPADGLFSSATRFFQGASIGAAGTEPAARAPEIGCRPFPYTGLRRERVLASPRFSEGRFRNTHAVRGGLKGNHVSVISELLLKGKERRPQRPLPFFDPVETWTRAPETGLRVTWLGHSTVLIEADGLRLLTDPVFGDRASPFSFAGAKRFHAVPADLDRLPPLDAVLLSHDHYDHYCRETLRRLARMDIPIVTSLGVGARLETLGFSRRRIVELDWWESHTLPGRDLSFTATPSQHFSGRTLTDRDRTLWSSFVIRTPRHRLFFSGDTGLTPEFEDIRRTCGPFDLILLEIGAWNQAWGDIHLGPHNALKAFGMLGGGRLLPVHWSTFDLGLHRWDEPAETLYETMQSAGTLASLLTPALGQAFEPARTETLRPWWRDLC